MKTSVCIAMDHIQLRNSLTDLFVTSGYQVPVKAANGKELLAAFEKIEQVPDICLLDVRMPVMDGEATCRKIKKSYPSVKVVVYAGALNADGAVDGAIPEHINGDPAGKIMTLRVEVDTKCARDLANKSPKISITVLNGKPPFKFKWEALPDNNCHVFPLNGTSSTSPIDSKIPGVISFSAPYKFSYRLTVYDASKIMKVANQIVTINLIKDSVYDLAMRDAYADRLHEPNDMEQINPNDWNIWLSPDLWNRQLQDDSLNHEDSEYFNQDPNYLYTRIHNYGCIASPDQPDVVKLYLYWTIASTGETWKMDWDGSGTPLNGHVCGEDIVPNGISIPSIPSGGEVILNQAWSPPKPQDYDTLPKIDVCVLARIQTSNTAPYGMATAEDTLTKDNVWNNNNIVTRNLVVNNFNTLNATSGTNGVIVGNSGTSAQTFTLELATDQMIRPFLHGDLSEYMTVSINLGQALYSKWVQGGRLGNPNSYNNSTYTVTYDLKKPLHLDNITLPGGSRYWAKITFSLKPDITVPLR